MNWISAEFGKEGLETHSSNVDVHVEHVEIPRDGRLGVENDALARLGDLDDGALDRRLVTQQGTERGLDETSGKGEDKEGDHEWGETVTGADDAGDDGTAEEDVGDEAGDQF
jgi:hypothetical protein